MEPIGAKLGKYAPKKTKNTERGELLRYFAERISAGRIADGMRAVTVARMARTLAHLSVKDLYYLKSVCEKAPHFSKKFWWEVNPKNHPAKEVDEEGPIGPF